MDAFERCFIDDLIKRLAKVMTDNNPPINMIFHKGDTYADYMQYYRSDMLNVFVGNRATGKSYSIDEFIRQAEAVKDFKIDEYEFVEGGCNFYRHDYKSLNKVKRPKFLDFYWFKKGDVISLNPNRSFYERTIMNRLLENEKVKYTIFIH